MSRVAVSPEVYSNRWSVSNIYHLSVHFIRRQIHSCFYFTLAFPSAGNTVSCSTCKRSYTLYFILSWSTLLFIFSVLRTF